MLVKPIPEAAVYLDGNPAGPGDLTPGDKARVGQGLESRKEVLVAP